MYLVKSRIFIEVSERDKMLKIIIFINKVVVIIGVGGVFCGYMVKEFVKVGVKVVLLDLN